MLHVASTQAVRAWTDATGGAASAPDSAAAQVALRRAVTFVGAAWRAEAAVAAQARAAVVRTYETSGAGARELRRRIVDAWDGWAGGDAERSPEAASNMGQLLVAAAALAASTSSDDVYRTLVVYSSPPGSFRARRQLQIDRQGGERTRRTQFAISSYPGISVGGEYAGAWGAHAGFSLPIGIEVTHARESGGSVGLFLSPLNLGTFADFRIDAGGASDGGGSTNQVGDVPAYTLAQAFSPSGYATVGLGDDVPATLGAGLAYVPRFRDVGQGTSGAIQVSIFLAVDVPLYIFR